MQAQAGESDVSAEADGNAVVNATVQPHSAPQPEKVHT